MLGNYKVKNAGLQPLHAKARLLAHEIGRVTFEHVGRAQNAHADRLANAAMDEARRRSLRLIGRRRRGRIAAAIRPAAAPSRRYEQNTSSWLAVQRSATKICIARGTPAVLSWSRAHDQPSKNQWPGAPCRREARHRRVAGEPTRLDAEPARRAAAAPKPACSNCARTSAPTS